MGRSTDEASESLLVDTPPAGLDTDTGAPDGDEHMVAPLDDDDDNTIVVPPKAAFTDG